MHTFLSKHAARLLIALLGLGLSCNNSSGSSESPTFDVSGSWEGTITNDDGDDPERFVLTVEFQGNEPDDGTVTAEMRFCRPESVPPRCLRIQNFQQICPEAQVTFLAGTVRGSNLDGRVDGSRADIIALDIDYSDANNGLGRYEYLGSDGDCLGEVGDIKITRRGT